MGSRGAVIGRCGANGRGVAATTGVRASSFPMTRTPCELRAHSLCEPQANPVRTPSLHALEAHNATLKADVERLEAQLAAAEARTTTAEARLEKQAAEFAERFAQHSADMAAERAQTEKALVEFSALAERLAALAEERAKPWWRRLRLRAV